MLSVFLAQIQEWKDVKEGGCTVDGVPTLKCLEVVAGNILTASSAIAIILLFVMFLYGSFSYMTSLGNPERIKKAQGTLRYAVIGFIIFISAYLLLVIIDTLFLGGCGKLLRFEIGGDGTQLPCN
jgi:hypothetical protein